MSRTSRQAGPWIAGAAFLALALVFGLGSTAFHEADDVTHYFFSRWLFRYPAKAVDIWGRPFITLFYALPAQLGPTAARLASLFFGIVIAWCATRLFRRAGGRDATLPVACTLGMPLLFFQLYGILTEAGFAALLGLGLVALRFGRPRAAALAWSLLPLARPEGFFLGPLLAGAFLVARDAHPSPRFSVGRFACTALLASGIALWWLAGLPVYRSAAWLIEEWPRNWAVNSVYGDGHPLLFIGFLVIVVTPLLFPFFVAGAVRMARAGLALEIVLVGFVVALHGILRTFGLFGSAGYPRYLVTLAPILGAASARGVEVALDGWEARRGAFGPRVRKAVAAAVTALLFATIFLWPQSGPVRGDADAQMLLRIWPWCAAEAASRPDVRFVADHPFFFVAGDLDPVRRGIKFQRHLVEYADVGTIAVWESKFAGRYSGMKNRADLEALGFERISKEEVAGPRPWPWEGPRPWWGDPELRDFDWDVFVKRR